MYKYCVAVETGLHDNFVKLRIGNCSTARWITFSTRILRVYMSGQLNLNAHHSECLERMVNFIVNIYYKVIIDIHGPKSHKSHEDSRASEKSSVVSVPIKMYLPV